MQRSLIVAAVSFAFFLVMMIAFYARQWFVYFLLATSFLIVNLFTLIGIWLQRRNNVRLHDKGLIYKKTTVLWKDISKLKLDPRCGLTIELEDSHTLNIPAVIEGLPGIAAHIDSRRKAD